MKKIIGLLRTSTSAQDTASQKADLTPYIISKGFKEEEIEWIDYKGASARKQDQRYLQMLEDIQTKILSKGIKNVAMWHLNRLGRNEIPLTNMKNFFKENSIQVYIKEGNLELFNTDGTINESTNIIWSIFATMIESDTKELLNKTNRGKEYFINSGKVFKHIYGYTKNSEGYAVVDEQNAKIVKEIFQLYASGQYSYVSLYNEIKDRGYKISESTFIKMLRDERYKGQSLENGTIVYPRIIEDDLWEKVLAVRQSNNLDIDKTNHKYHYGNKLIICESCQKHYVNVGVVYEDISYSRPQYKCEHPFTINTNFVNFVLMYASFSSYFKDFNTDVKERNKEIRLAISQNNDKIDNINKEISDIQKSLDRTINLYVENKINEDKFNSLSEKYKGQIQSNEERIKLLQSDNKRFRKQLDVKVLSYEEVRKFENSFFNEEDKKSNYEIIHKYIKICYLRRIKINNYSAAAFNIMYNNGRISTFFFISRLHTNNKIFGYSDIDGKLYNINHVSREIKDTELQISREQIEDIRNSPLPKHIYNRDKEQYFIDMDRKSYEDMQSRYPQYSREDLEFLETWDGNED